MVVTLACHPGRMVLVRSRTVNSRHDNVFRFCHHGIFICVWVYVCVYMCSRAFVFVFLIWRSAHVKRANNQIPKYFASVTGHVGNSLTRRQDIHYVWSRSHVPRCFNNDVSALLSMLPCSQQPFVIHQWKPSCSFFGKMY